MSASNLPSGAGTRVKVPVYGIQNARGEWYTGDVIASEPEFTADKERALELDVAEADLELEAADMPEDARVVVLHEYFREVRESSAVSGAAK